MTIGFLAPSPLQPDPCYAAMLRNYLKTALRHLQRHPGYTAINVFGLAVGLACVLVIGLYVRHELSYDRFHPQADRIYRVAADIRVGDRETRVPLAPAPMSAALRRDFPAVQAATRLYAFTGNTLVRHGDRRFVEDRFYYADSSFFQVFEGFALLHGDPETALEDPNAIVLTISMAEKYFGDADPLGQTLQAADRTWRVTGVVREAPANSHLQFDLLASMGALEESQSPMWLSTNFMTYVKLRPSADAVTFEDQLTAWVRQYAASQMEQFFGATFEELEAGGGRYWFFLQPLTDIHLHSQLEYELEANSDIAYVYIFSAIAIFILLIACVNFMNLATARAADRAAEVGMRKALGAQRRQLAGQFMGEALLTAGAALGAALLLARTALPAFNDVVGLALDSDLLLSGPVLIGMGGLVIVVGIVAGSYPALMLSGFRPAAVLKRTAKHTSGGGDEMLRKGLVVFQFAITIALLVGTAVVYNQMDYIQNKNLGYDRERVMIITRGLALGEQQKAFKDQIQQMSGIASAGAADGVFLDDVSNTTFVPDGLPVSAAQSMSYTEADDRFVEAVGLTVVQGRNFSPARAADSTAILINQQAARLLGWTDPVGKQLRMPLPNRDDIILDVIGVVADFHFQSLHQPIQPLVVMLEQRSEYVYARLEPGAMPQAIDALRATWQQFAPEEPFNYTFLDQNFAALHQATQRTGRLFGLFTGLAVIVACLGLFGLATHAAQRRTREVGIRKALGASVASIVGLLSKEFLQLVGIAFVVAVPVAYVAMQQWLQDFAYRIDLSVGVFVLAGLLALVIALSTVSVQAVRAARTDPAKALRSE